MKTKTLPDVLGLAGRKRSGKTMLAQACRDSLGYRIVSFADPLKGLACDILGCSWNELHTMKDDGTTFDPPYDKTADLLSSVLKTERSDIEKKLAGKPLGTVRDVLQTVGTDIIRSFNPNWHVNKTRETIQATINNGVRVVVDDVRFVNERYMIEQDFGGVVYFLVRPSCGDISNHWSERQLCWPMFGFNYTILNIYSKEELCEEFLYRIGGSGSHILDITYAEYDANMPYHYPIERYLTGIAENDANFNLVRAIVLNNKYEKNGFIYFTSDDSERTRTVTDPLIIENHKLHV